MKELKIKGSFSDLKPALKGLKNLMGSVEVHDQGDKEDMYEAQERDLLHIKRHGTANNG